MLQKALVLHQQALVAQKDKYKKSLRYLALAEDEIDLLRAALAALQPVPSTASSSSAISHEGSDGIYDLDFLDLPAADEAEMIAENTLDADRVVTFNQDLDLRWVYQNDDGSTRRNVIEMGEDILRAKPLLAVV